MRPLIPIDHFLAKQKECTNSITEIVHPLNHTHLLNENSFLADAFLGPPGSAVVWTHWFLDGTQLSLWESICRPLPHFIPKLILYFLSINKYIALCLMIRFFCSV